MKLMVSALMLVAICHAAEVSRSRREEEEKTAKRELLEGNFGLRTQSSFIESTSRPQDAFDGNFLREQGPPQKEYGPPRQPIAKISDVLTGQGPSFTAAIQSHLYSPLPVYQPRLGTPTNFEVSPPVPSPLAYSERKIYQAIPNIQSLNDNLQALHQNHQPSLPPPLFQQPPAPFNAFPTFSQLQPPRQPQPVLSNEFLPRMDTTRLFSQLDFPQQIYQQVFSEQSGVIPQDIYQQINQLGSQLPYDETTQQDTDADANYNKNSGDANQQEQNPGIQYARQTYQQGQLIKDKSRAPQQQSSAKPNANFQPQAVSYASFSQNIPVTTQSQAQVQQLPALPSPQPLPQQQQLPQPQLAPLFKPVQTTQAQATFQSAQTTPSPSSTFFTMNQTPRRIGVIRIRQDQTTPQPQTSSTLEPQASSTSTVISTDNSQPLSALQQSQSTRYSSSLPRFQPQPPLRPTVKPRTTLESSTLQSQNTFSTRSTLPPLPPLPRRKQSTLQTFSTSQFPTSSSEPAFTQSLVKLPPQPVTQTVPTSTSLPISFQPQFIQPILTPLPVLQPQQIQTLSTQPQPLPTAQPLQQVTTLQPLVVTQPQELSTASQTDTTSIRPIPVQRQQYQAQSETESKIQFNVFKSVEKSQDQILQQPQLQLIQESQQMQQQIQPIQQQLQFIQHQPQLNQQQPQPVHIIQQQTQPFPQPVQLIQQEQLNQQELIQKQLQPVQLIQQQPQLIQSQPQLIQSQPQLIQSQPQLIQSQPQLIQSQPQLIQSQPQLIQSQPQLIQSQPQLIQSQPQSIPPPPQQIQLIQQQSQPQPEPSPKPQIETDQKSQEYQQQNEQKQQQHSEKSEKQETEGSQEPNEDDEYHSQFLQNNVYSEELYIQPQHLHPVPVAFPSYATSSLHVSPTFHSTSSLHASPLHASPLHSSLLLSSPLHSSFLHSSPLHSSHLHSSSLHSSPSFHGHSLHSSSPPFSSVQYYGKYAPDILGGWRQ